MSNNNNNRGLRKEVVLPPTGSGAQNIGTGGNNADKLALKQRLSEIKTQQKALATETKGIQKQLAPKKKAPSNKTTVATAKKTTTTTKKSRK